MGAQEMFLIAGIALLLFGGKKLPELMRGLGQGMREFKDASSGVREEIENTINSKPSTKVTKPKVETEVGPKAEDQQESKGNLTDDAGSGAQSDSKTDSKTEGAKEKADATHSMHPGH